MILFPCNISVTITQHFRRYIFMKRKILPALLAVAAVGTAGLTPLSVHAAAPQGAIQFLQNNSNCNISDLNSLGNINNPSELKQKLDELGINYTIIDKSNCNLNGQTGGTPSSETPVQPETPEQPVTTPEEPAATPEQPVATPEQPVVTQPDNSTQPGSGTENANYVQQVVNLVNQERAKAGLSPVTADSTIQAAAQVRAKETEVSFSHTRPDGSSFSTALTQQGVQFRGSGENIAWGQRSPEEVMNGWMNSPGHRANILNANYTKIGVGYYQNGSGTNYWTQLFTY
jgi:uncharacterized protein YkwD